MDFSCLQGVTAKETISCVNSAFSDYSIPIHFNESTIDRFFSGSGIDMSVSFGAYDNGKMVGFIFNSFLECGGEPVVFDAASGVVPSCRNKGIFTNLYAFAEKELNKRGIKKYYLEVLKNNARAVNLYRRLGFSVVREFSVMICKSAPKVELHSSVKEIPYAELAHLNMDQLIIVKPSFEHSDGILQKCADAYGVRFLCDRNGVSAFCVYALKDGRIVQMGYRRLNDLKTIITALTSEYPMIAIKNIEISYAKIIEMLLSVGFVEMEKQFEMEKDI